MLAAAPLSPIALPNMAPAAKRKKNLPAKVKAPKGPPAKPLSNESAMGMALVTMTKSELNIAANIMSTPRRAIHISKATLPRSPR